MTKPSLFDYIIIGNGLAGLQLALKLSEDDFFSDKQIALIDPSTKSENDKTWSFWHHGESQWNSIILKSWENASVITSKKRIDLNLSPYKYHSIRSIDFYNTAKTQLQNKKNIHFIIEEVISTSENDMVTVTTTKNQYTALHVFDSRISKKFFEEKDKYISIIQHFKGWIIKTKKDEFQTDNLTMMDYRLKDGNQTSFMYVLPYSKTEALVEFTYFTQNVVTEDVYDQFIKTYIKDYLKIEDYTITETEMGQIPMTTYNFSKFNTSKITKIGTAGGWVKGSSGYSFKLTEQKVARIIKNLKTNKNPARNLFKIKYRFYDKVFLSVLKDENHKGEWIFQEFYGSNSTTTMLRFLDEESTLIEDLKVMFSLISWSFIRASFKTF